MRAVAEQRPSIKTAPQSVGKPRPEGRIGLAGQLLKIGYAQRRQMARELHDTTMQNLAAALMLADEVRAKLCARDRRQRQSLANLQALLDQSLGELKRMSKLLHPPLIEEIGLVSALRSSVREFERRSGIVVTLSVQEGEQRERNLDVETTLFYVTEEALANVARHSGSATVKVTLIRTSENSLVEIADKGVGIPQWPVSGDVSDLPCRGIGLAGMRARLGSLGGELRISSSALGTKVRALVPTQSGTAEPSEPLKIDDVAARCEEEKQRLRANLIELRATASKLRNRSLEMSASATDAASGRE
jgi:two-component system, NarL family, sensor kinase